MSTKKVFKAPKAKMEGINTKELQEYLWKGKPFPPYFNHFYLSESLMKIFKLLVHDPEAWHDGLLYDLTTKDKLHLVFGTDYRHIYTYKVMEDFTLAAGELSEIEELPAHFTPLKAREVRAGDTILIRRDTRDEELKVDVQILTHGLFQDSSDDFRSFRVDTSDIAQFRKYLKLVDDDGVEESFI